MRNLWDNILRLLGAILALVSCIPMLAMLPGGFASALVLLGLAAPLVAAWTAPLAPIAPWLLILSVALIVIGDLRCGWQPTILAALGGLLVYLSMYVLVTPVATDTMTDMQGMVSADAAQSTMAGLTNAPMFYIGLALMIGSFALVLWRRWKKVCQPFNPVALLRATRRG
jgi:hypothetical protein